jgi:DNA-binding beta-propeller fold protein YncE
LQAAITAADISTPGTAQVSVSTPGPGGGMTGALTFTIVQKALVSVQVAPGNPSITSGTKQQFTATGTFNDGSKQDLTASAAWSSSNTTVATINSSGLATAVAIGRPKVTATSGSLSASTTLISVAGPGAAAPRFAYVTNLNDDTLSIYAVNAATGQLRANGYVQTGNHPNSVCLDPSGKFAYTANDQANDVSAFNVDSATGSLTPVPGSPFAAGSTPFAVTVDPSGTFVYVTNFQSANISAYAIDRSTGALTPVPGSPFAAGAGGPTSVAIDPAGRFAFVANSSVNVPVFSIDVNTGALQPIAGSPFPTGTSGGSATIHPTSLPVYHQSEYQHR